MFFNSRKNTILFIAIIFCIGVFFYPGYLILANQTGSDIKSEIQAVSKELEQKKDKINQLKKKINAYQKDINKERNKALSLSSQLNILKNEISKLETEIELKDSQIDEVSLEIQDALKRIEQTKEDIKKQKDRVAAFLREIYRDDEKDALEIIITMNSFSDFFNNIHNIEVLTKKTKDSLSQLKNTKFELEIFNQDMEDKKMDLENLLQELEDKKASLESNTAAKSLLLFQSRSSETRFQNMVGRLKQEQAAINQEIRQLENSIRQKLESQDKQRLEALGNADFVWPVPNLGITAYFHDPDYPFRYIFEHPGIDVRAKQGTPVKASASGYVARVKFDGTTKYAYVMIVHNNGLSTVYSHISKPLVKEDQFVMQGDIVALSGGMPGTPGSGRLTTGPHLQFEIRKNGVPVNPLDYLP